MCNKFAKQRFAEKMQKLGLWLFALISFAAMVLFITYSYVGSPKEYLLKKQNESYAKQLSEIEQRITELNRKVASIEERDDELYRPIYNLEPIPDDKRTAGVGGSEPYKFLEGYQNSEAIIATMNKVDRLGRKLYVQLKSFNELERAAERQKKRLASIPAIQPVAVSDLIYISSFYGYRDHPKLHRWIKHKGIDFVAHKGSPIYATGNGVVERTTSRWNNYGISVKINHGFGYESLYAHMNKRIVAEGDSVRRGQIIGYVGGTGRVTGVHLHYEVLKDGRSINPRAFYQEDLSADEYDAMISAQSY